MKTIKLVIADDHELFRNGLKELLKKHDDIEVTKCVGDGLEFMELVKSKQEIDIVLLDITMPNLDGFGVLDKLKGVNPNIKPIVISMHDEGNYIAKCAKMGAFSYMLKNTDQDELLKVIRTVSKGKKYFSPAISERMIDYMSDNSMGENLLSKKETEVLELISKGNTTKEIASMLYVSSRTIETHRSNIIKKLNAKNTADLIVKAVKMKLV